MNTKLKHRMAKKTVQILKEDGTALKNTEVTYELENHKFLFGCGAFDFTEYMMKQGTEEENYYKDRLDKWLEVFNYGTIPFYLGSYEPTEGQPLEENRMAAANYLREHGATVKGHPLCWHTVCAPWLMKYDNKTILHKQLQRIEREVTHFKGIVDMWDVINEVVIMPIFDKYDNAITRICKDMGRVSLIREVFQAAQAANPDGIFLLNDFNTSISYEILIDGCLEAGVPISAIGIQSHQHQGYWGKEKLEEVLARFEHFGLPIHFTENTLVSGELMPQDIQDLNDFQGHEWPTTKEGEARQMREMEQMYTTLFEHPLVEAITGWDFADGMWLDAPSGMIRKDNSIKPAFKRLRELVKDQWSTKDTVKTDEQGFVTLEGFKGEYRISAKNGMKTRFSLGMEGNENTRIIVQ